MDKNKNQLKACSVTICVQSEQRELSVCTLRTRRYDSLYRRHISYYVYIYTHSI